MVDALNAASASMANDLSRMNALSRNLANATTTAYKREIALGTGFEGLMANTLHNAAIAEDAVGASTAIDHRHGTLRQTGHPLDFAIEGDGFFEVRTASGIAYTRRGDFRVDALGQLVTQAGNAVQGASGALHIGANPTVDRDGRILEGEKTVGQLKVVQFADPRQLSRGSAGLFHAQEQPLVAAPGAARLRQGHLEASNVNTAAEMVKLIETVRHFEATQKVVQGIDEMTERALRKLGEF
jgi:flagellar basal-body rod protein FlgF